MHRVRSAFALVLKKESEAPPQPTRELSATGGESWLVYVDLQSFAFHQNAPAADRRIHGRLGDAENEMAQRGVGPACAIPAKPVADRSRRSFIASSIRTSAAAN